MKGEVIMYREDGTEQNQENNQTGKPKKGFTHTLIKTVIGAVIAGIAAGGAFVTEDWFVNRSMKVADTTPISDEQMDTTEYSGVAQIVKNIKPAIVAITSTQQEVDYDFFGRPSVSKSTGAGSGIIVGQAYNELLIATNNHVVDGSTNIIIQFNDETTAAGKIKGSEVYNDLAIVSVNMRQLSKETIQKIRIASLGDSTKCRQGDMVVAIGNALGYGQSTTVGYISAINREVSQDGVTLNLLQTDAAINPGNSGGALVNAKGEVIGINSIKFVDIDVEGVGYSIPISIAIPILNDITNRRELSERDKGYLGISSQDVTQKESDLLNLPVGIYIKQVEKHSPADQAGMKPRDIICGVNGRAIDTQEKLAAFLDYTPAGTVITMEVYSEKDGEYVKRQVEVTLGHRR